MPFCGTTYIVYYLGDKMKRSVKILSFIGLGLYGVGVLLNIVNSISELFTTFGFSLFSENTDFSLTTLGLVIVSILINLIIAAVIVLFEYRFFKSKRTKKRLKAFYSSGCCAVSNSCVSGFKLHTRNFAILSNRQIRAYRYIYDVFYAIA